MAIAPPVQRAPGAASAAVEPEQLAHEMFERHRARVLAYCHRRLGSREEAEDALQTTYLNALGALRRGAEPASEIAWLLGIARNVCVAHWDARRRHNRLELANGPDAIERAVSPDAPDQDELRALETALGGLTELQRRAILLREWRGLAYAEIAAELGVSVAAVETLIFRARRALAMSLEEQGVGTGRKLARALDLGWLASAFKAVFGGGAAAKVAATGAVLGTALLAGGSAPEPPAPRPASERPTLSEPRVARGTASVLTPAAPAVDPVDLPGTHAAASGSGPDGAPGSKKPGGGPGSETGEGDGQPGSPGDGTPGTGGGPLGPGGPVGQTLNGLANGVVNPLLETATTTVGSVVTTATGVVDTTVGTATGTVGSAVETTGSLPVVGSLPLEETTGGLLGGKKKLLP